MLMSYASRLTCTSLMLALLVSPGCDDPATVPGNLEVNWALPPVVSCDAWGIERLEISLVRGDLVEDRVTDTCRGSASSGRVALLSLTPGRYTVEVEGLDADGVGRYFGTSSAVSVPEGSTAETEPIQLTLKRAAVAVDWSLPGGGKCSSARVLDVEVQLFSMSGSWQSPGIVVECDAVFEDPGSGRFSAGVLFEGIPIPNMAGMAIGIVVTGYDELGDTVARGEVRDLTLLPGDRVDELLPLR